MTDQYSGFKDRVAGDVHKASLSANVVLGDNIQKVRIRDSALPSQIPAASTIEVMPVVFHKLKFGQIIYVKLGNDLCLRRFVRLEMIQDTDVLVLASERSKKLDRVLANALVGRVSAAMTQAGRPIRLRHSGTLMDALTDFGTTTPWHKLRRLLSNWKGDKPPEALTHDDRKKKKAKRKVSS